MDVRVGAKLIELSGARSPNAVVQAMPVRATAHFRVLRSVDSRDAVAPIITAADTCAFVVAVDAVIAPRVL